MNTITYIARMIVQGQVVQTIEFEAVSDHAAWKEANAGVDPLRGAWVDVQRKSNPQGSLDLE